MALNSNQDHVIHLVNGQLRDVNPHAKTSKQDVTRLVNAALNVGPNPHLVLHFHGGLVSEKAGRAVASTLAPVYAGPNRYPIFFVWESGFFEAIVNNLQDIGRDPLFRALVKKVARWVLEQLPTGAGFKGAGARVDAEQLEGEFDEFFAGYDDKLPTALQGRASSAVLRSAATGTPDEEALRLKIQLDLAQDFEFQHTLDDIGSTIDLTKPAPKSDALGHVVSPVTEIAPQQAGDVFDVSQGKRGIVAIAKVAMFIAKVVIDVVRRFRGGRDHGLYPTIVEEVLSAAYIDKVGGVIWGQMKKDTQDAFGNAANTGGAAILDEIAKQQSATGKEFNRITLIGHSTGAIYICNLIDAAATLLPNARFEVVFLAPAVTFRRLNRTLQAHQARVSQFRMFGMHDAVECADQMIPIMYPRSLLYFVSGVVEFKVGATDRAIDEPLVGMERYRLDSQTFSEQEFPDITQVERILASYANSYVWSVAQGNAGYLSEAVKHGDFDDDAQTLSSLKHILTTGFYP